MDSNQVCIALSSGACERCSSRKQRCSLMPLNPVTGKTDRRQISAAEIQEYRINQTKELRGKGKQRAGDPDAGNPEDSPLPSPSPLVGLSGLGSLTLESGGSSAANTPCDSPAALSQPSVTEGASTSLPPAPIARRSSRRKSGIWSSFIFL
jgi:hypothetical protein